jgi:hypothetical protein
MAPDVNGQFGESSKNDLSDRVADGFSDRSVASLDCLMRTSPEAAYR